ncbi:unnamed protein product, partial [Phaeothamnion confervicola]
LAADALGEPGSEASVLRHGHAAWHGQESECVLSGRCCCSLPRYTWHTVLDVMFSLVVTVSQSRESVGIVFPLDPRGSLSLPLVHAGSCPISSPASLLHSLEMDRNKCP